MARSSRHIDSDDGARHQRLVQRLAIGGAAVLTLVVLALFTTLIRGASRQSIDPVADPQAVASATASPSPSASASPSPSPSPSAPASRSAPPTHAPTHAPTRAATHAPAPAHTTAKPPSGNASYESQVVTLVNQARATAGCPALTVDSRLTTAARGHSQDMATRNYFDHNTPDGVTPWTRITDAGYHYSQAAENIAEGQATPASVMDAWMNSPPHKANILNCALRNLGVGLAYNSSHTPYWTQDFGTPQ
ncbi:CAP domain-containing protein [Rugosimonospora acidiphila]